MVHEVQADRPARPLLRLVRLGALALVAYLVLGNGLILGASAWASWRNGPAVPIESSISNLAAVDGKLWRGGAPGSAGLADLAEHGVTTIVDLRAEEDVTADEALLSDLGLERFHLPVRDGQLPTAEQAQEFVDIVEGSDGTVFVHCGAGVGRTGAMVAHYLTATGDASGADALRRNLAVGPPSLEQIVFAAGADRGDYDRPGPVTTALSRVLDSPRRIWHNLT